MHTWQDVGGEVRKCRGPRDLGLPRPPKSARSSVVSSSSPVLLTSWGPSSWCTSLQALARATYLMKGAGIENFRSGTEEVTLSVSQGPRGVRPLLSSRWLHPPASFCRLTSLLQQAHGAQCCPRPGLTSRAGALCSPRLSETCARQARGHPGRGAHTWGACETCACLSRAMV